MLTTHFVFFFKVICSEVAHRLYRILLDTDPFTFDPLRWLDAVRMKVSVTAVESQGKKNTQISFSVGGQSIEMIFSRNYSFNIAKFLKNTLNTQNLCCHLHKKASHSMTNCHMILLDKPRASEIIKVFLFD